MKIIKTAYSYENCCEIQNKEEKNSNIINPIILFLGFMKVAGFCIGIFAAGKFFVFIDSNFCFSSYMLASLLLFIIPMTIFSVIYCFISALSEVTKATLIKNGKIKVNRLEQSKHLKLCDDLKNIYSDFNELKDIYSDIEFLMLLPIDCLQECQYYKVYYGLEIVGKNGEYFFKYPLELGKYRDEICKEDCVDFSVLDSKLKEITNVLGIEL